MCFKLMIVLSSRSYCMVEPYTRHKKMRRLRSRFTRRLLVFLKAAVPASRSPRMYTRCPCITFRVILCTIAPTTEGRDCSRQASPFKFSRPARLTASRFACDRRLVLSIAVLQRTVFHKTPAPLHPTLPEPNPTQPSPTQPSPAQHDTRQHNASQPNPTHRRCLSSRLTCVAHAPTDSEGF